MVWLTVAALVAVGWLGYWLARPGSTVPTPFLHRQTLQLTKSGQAQRQALAPDGKYIVYAVQEGQQQSLWVQQTATGSSVQIIAPATVVYHSLSFSPDGNYIYFTQPGQTLTLFRIPTLGGQSVKLLDDVGSPPALAPDGRQMAFVRHNPAQGEESLRLAQRMARVNVCWSRANFRIGFLWMACRCHRAGSISPSAWKTNDFDDQNR
jgi:hypothetical protein